MKEIKCIFLSMLLYWKPDLMCSMICLIFPPSGCCAFSLFSFYLVIFPKSKPSGDELTTLKIQLCEYIVHIFTKSRPRKNYVIIRLKSKVLFSSNLYALQEILLRIRIPKIIANRKVHKLDNFFTVNHFLGNQKEKKL